MGTKSGVSLKTMTWLPCGGSGLSLSCGAPSEGPGVKGPLGLQSDYLSSSPPQWAWSPGTRGRRVASAPRHSVTGTDFYQVSQRGLGPSAAAGGCCKRETARQQGPC